MYCKKCGTKNIKCTKTFNEEYVCDNCKNNMFVCPGCGMIYEQDDFINGDSKNGFCVKCNKEKEV